MNYRSYPRSSEASSHQNRFMRENSSFSTEVKIPSTKKENIIVHNGQEYDRSVLESLMRTFPIISKEDNPLVANVVVSDEVPRYVPTGKGYSNNVWDLVLVDSNLKPVLAPVDVTESNVFHRVALVSKHSFKRAQAKV